MRRLIVRSTAIALVLAAVTAAATVSVKCCVVIGSGQGVVDRINEAMVEMSAAAGLRLRTLTVEGRTMTAREDLLGALDIEIGSPTVAIDVARGRAAIEALPWVKSAKIERRLPDAIHIVLEERAPYALWQRGERYTLVDRDGSEIIDVPEAASGLPLIVGPDAPLHVAALFDTLRDSPDLAKRVHAAVRVGARRWNLYLDGYESGIAVRLPEEGMAEAWTRLATLERDHKILERDLEFIDLRLEDRLVVRLRKAAPGPAPAGGTTTPRLPLTTVKQDV